jgi:hypothetical protein
MTPDAIILSQHALWEFTLTARQVRLVRLSGIYEVHLPRAHTHAHKSPSRKLPLPNSLLQHYNPLTGAGYGARGLGMSTLVCDWLQRL